MVWLIHSNLANMTIVGTDIINSFHRFHGVSLKLN